MLHGRIAVHDRERQVRVVAAASVGLGDVSPVVAPVMDGDNGCSYDSVKFGKIEVLLAGTNMEYRLNRGGLYVDGDQVGSGQET